MFRPFHSRRGSGISIAGLRHLLSVLAGVCALMTALTPAHAATAGHMALPVVRPVIRCGELVQTSFAGVTDDKVTIRSAQLQKTAKGPFCKVSGTIAPSIGFEVSLPTEHWTQRYLQTGCGGLCGRTNLSVSNAATCTPAVNGEFVVATNDLGHQSTEMGLDEGKFGADPQKRIDFAYRANHQTALVAKALTRAFYGHNPRFSYFSGCSDGGREALMEAQRYPDDFDGISAGAPAALFQVQNSFYHAWYVMANRRADGTNILLASRLPILHRAVVAQCATGSGVKDGILEAPYACHFDPASVQCPASATNTDNCLTAEEVTVARRIYSGPTDASGRPYTLGGPLPGSENAWMLPDSRTGKAMSYGIAASAMQYVILPRVTPAAADLTSFRFDDATFSAVSTLAPLNNAGNTDLRGFHRHGGKLILWQGWSDTSIAPQISLAYYAGVQKEMGIRTTDSFLRLFMIPGVGHCGGGDGFSEVDTLTPLMAWTELGHKPQKLIAGKPGNNQQAPAPKPQTATADAPATGKPSTLLHGEMFQSSPLPRAAQPLVATRPVFPYPLIARWTGKGSPDDAANYVAVRPEVGPARLPDSRALQLIGPDNQHVYGVVDGQLKVQ